MSSSCKGLNYIYLVWTYFLFYIGAGYPSWYYPYIIATLLDFVPSECGGTGGAGGSLDTAGTSLLSLLETNPGLGFSGTGTGSSYGYVNGQYYIYPQQQSYSDPGNVLTKPIARWILLEIKCSPKLNI